MKNEESNALAAKHFSYAMKIAWDYIHTNRVPDCDGDDFRSEAVMGLLSASRNYDITSGVPFGAYARHRILGRMRDFMRDKRGLRHNQNSGGYLSIKNRDPLFEEHASYEMLEVLPTVVWRGAVTLPKRWQGVVRLRYEEGWKEREIGELIGVNESRVSQILKAARGRLKQYLETQGIGSVADVL